MPSIDCFEFKGEIWDIQPPIDYDVSQLNQIGTPSFETALTMAQLSKGERASIQSSTTPDLSDEVHRAAYLGLVFGRLHFSVEKSDLVSPTTSS